MRIFWAKIFEALKRPLGSLSGEIALFGNLDNLRPIPCSSNDSSQVKYEQEKHFEPNTNQKTDSNRIISCPEVGYMPWANSLPFFEQKTFKKLFVHQSNDCYIVAVLNISLNNDKFTEIIKNVDDPLIKIINLLIQKEYTTLEPVRNELFESFRNSEMSIYRMGDAKMFLQELLGRLSHILTFKMPDTRVLFTKEPGWQFLFDDKILILEHFEFENKKEYRIKKKYSKYMKKFPELVFVSNDLDSSLIDKANIRTKLSLGIIRYELFGAICFQGNHYSPAFHHLDKFIPYDESDPITTDIENVQILIFQKKVTI